MDEAVDRVDASEVTEAIDYTSESIFQLKMIKEVD